MGKSYVFDSEWEQERRRIASIEECFDPGTQRHLTALGAGPGKRCLEVGAGGGSITRWLADIVAPSGRVVATDLDTAWLEEIDHPNVEVRRHDITADELEEDTYDFVHARCLLEHLPQRDEILKRMLAALRPGGWLLVEDVDFTPNTAVPASKQPVHPAGGARNYAKVWRAMAKLATAAGWDPEFARRLPFELIGAGLDEVGGETFSRLIRGGTTLADFTKLTLAQVREMLVGAGLLTERDADFAIARAGDPEAWFMSATIVSAWGRKPS